MRKIVLIIPFFLMSCSNQDLPNLKKVEDSNIPRCGSGAYIQLFSGDIIQKISENPKIEIIYSENNSKKLCLISGEIKILGTE